MPTAHTPFEVMIFFKEEIFSTNVYTKMININSELPYLTRRIGFPAAHGGADSAPPILKIFKATKDPKFFVIDISGYFS